MASKLESKSLSKLLESGEVNKTVKKKVWTTSCRNDMDGITDMEFNSSYLAVIWTTCDKRVY